MHHNHLGGKERRKEFEPEFVESTNPIWQSKWQAATGTSDKKFALYTLMLYWKGIWERGQIWDTDPDKQQDKTV